MTAALEKYKAIAYETGSIARLSDAEKTAAEKERRKALWIISMLSG